MRDIIRERKNISEQLKIQGEYVQANFSGRLKLSMKLVDLLLYQFDIITWTFLAIHSDDIALLGSAVQKSCMGLLSCIELEKKGLYGSSRIIMRHIFESLMVAKFYSVSRNEEVIDRWKEGMGYPMRKIFKNIHKPDTEEMEKLWGVLCHYTHASIYSQQVVLDSEFSKTDHQVNSNLTRALIEMTFHLLHMHLIDSRVKNYMRLVDAHDEIALINTLKAEQNKLLKLSRTIMSKETKSLIRGYRSAWEVSNTIT